MMRQLSTMIGLLAVTFVLTAYADLPAAKKDDKARKPDNATVDVKDRALLQQQLLKQRFQEFKNQLRTLKDKLVKGTLADKATATALDNALREIERKRLDADFTDLVKILAHSKLGTVEETNEALAKSKKLADEVRALIDILREDGKAAKRREENKRLEELIKELDGIIKAQKVARAWNVRDGISKAELARIQKSVTRRAEDLKRALEGSRAPQEDTAEARKGIQAGTKHQKDAESKIEDDKRKLAGMDQEGAIREFEKARQKLEELLRQAREEELERLLTALENRCREMLDLQRLVKAATVAIDKTVLANKDKKPDRGNMIESGKQAEKENKIVGLAARAIEMIQAEGSALAFDAVFQQVQEDMKKTQGLLEKTKVGSITQTIEQDIIDHLEETIEALRKAKQDLGQSQPGQSTPPPAQDQKLLDDIAQLKMIRSMQARVNKRTKMYHKQLGPNEPEQATNKDVKDEILKLSGRQQQLFDVTMKIAKGDNK